MSHAANKRCPRMGRDDRLRDVDRTSDTGHHVRFLERASRVDQLRQLNRGTYELMQVQSGRQVLDVGFGARRRYPRVR